jgi:hypothetical protein
MLKSPVQTITTLAPVSCVVCLPVVFAGFIKDTARIWAGFDPAEIIPMGNNPFSVRCFFECAVDTKESAQKHWLSHAIAACRRCERVSHSSSGGWAPSTKGKHRAERETSAAWPLAQSGWERRTALIREPPKAKTRTWTRPGMLGVPVLKVRF